MTRKNRSSGASGPATPAPAARAPAPLAFTPIRLRKRRDGWTADRQVAFIAALAESGCVDEACQRVGMRRASAYALLSRNDSISFRAAWDAALDLAIGALGDAARSRAIHGVTRPVFYKGEQIGERRYFDERLTMFLLKTRDPERYGVWRDRFVFNTSRESKAQQLAAMTDLVLQKAVEYELGNTLIEPSAPRRADTPDTPPEDPPADAPGNSPENPFPDPT